MPEPRAWDRRAGELIETFIVPRMRDLGGFSARRALLPFADRMIGPFILLDQAGPSELLIEARQSGRRFPG
jgi:redox-sensitive bicupin YhaK (pirin superfamily)